jgi:hypothetical protein
MPAGVRLEARRAVWYSGPAAREPILARREEHMKLARIITIAMTVVFATGVALAPWTPVNAEDASSKTKDTKDKPKSHKKSPKKSAKTETPSAPKQEKGGY